MQIKLLILLSALGTSGTHGKEPFLSSSPAGLGDLACAATYRHRDFPVRLLGVLVYLHVHIAHLMDTAFRNQELGEVGAMLLFPLRSGALGVFRRNLTLR